MRKAIVLSSGGIDSTTCLAMAIDEFGTENVVSVSAIYGQKHSKEIECARKIATYYGVAHREIDITSLNIFEGSTCTLLKENAGSVAQGTYAEQVNEGIVSTYVPFRNGVLLSLVAAMAMSMFPNDEILIYVGMHLDDVIGAAYADCTFQFADAMKRAYGEQILRNADFFSFFVNLCQKDEYQLGGDAGEDTFLDAYLEEGFKDTESFTFAIRKGLGGQVILSDNCMMADVELVRKEAHGE